MNDVVLCGAEIEKSTIIQYYSSEGTTTSEIVGVLASMLFWIQTVTSFEFSLLYVTMVVLWEVKSNICYFF